MQYQQKRNSNDEIATYSLFNCRKNKKSDFDPVHDYFFFSNMETDS